MKTLSAILIALLVYSCTFLNEPIHFFDPDIIDPEPIEIDTVPVDTIPVDTLPIEQDTVCTSHTPITSPAFITSYMIMDDWQDYIVLNVYPHSDTIYEGEDIQPALDSMVGLIVPQYPRKVYVHDDNRLLQSVMLKGTNDKSKLLGKIWIRYFGARYYFGCEPQSMEVMGSQTEAEFNENLIEFPSFNMINWLHTDWDSIGYVKSMTIALDSAHCKGGRDWFDTRFNPYEPLPQLLNYAEEAGWNDVLSNVGEVITLEGRVSDSEIMKYLNEGYIVKVKD